MLSEKIMNEITKNVKKQEDKMKEEIDFEELEDKDLDELYAEIKKEQKKTKKLIKEYEKKFPFLKGKKQKKRD